MAAKLRTKRSKSSNDGKNETFFFKCYSNYTFA